MKTQRNFSRYDDIGRFEVSELCALPGALVNISREGCKIRYDFPVNVDLESDYNAKITFARSAMNGQYRLLCRPRWVLNVGESTEIGFQILPSQDFSNLSKYIEELEEDQNSENLENEFQNQTFVCQI